MSYIRRGSAYSSLGKMEKAFNDYTSAEKQLRQLRDMGKHCNMDFISLYYNLVTPYMFSLKGELYRRNHAFYNAHQYFYNAVSKLEDNMVAKMGTDTKKTVDLSLKMVRLKVLKGKTFLELGEFRKSLKWFLKALEHLLGILQLMNKDFFADLFTYLDETRLDPKLLKCDLFWKLLTVTKEMEITIRKPDRLLRDYGILLSDIANRISLVIFLLNLPDYDRPEVAALIEQDQEAATDMERRNRRANLLRHLLAWKWLLFALYLNPKNSLARFNDVAFGLAAHPYVKEECDKAKLELGIQPIGINELMEFGSLRDIKYREIARQTLEALSETEQEDQQYNMAKSLLQRLLLHTEDFSIKNAEFYKYLMKAPHERILKTKSDDERSDIYFYVLQRWSSINPALPRPSAFKIKGGGYFLIFKGKGIAIDPGINFVENLYSEGFSIADIDYVIATHDHIDHTADIDTILSLHYKRYKQGEKKCITLLLNPSVSSRYIYLLQQKPELFRKIELVRGMQMPIDGFEGDLVIEPKMAEHLDLSSPNVSNAIGVVLVFYPAQEKRRIRIGITGDTKYSDAIMDQYLDVDILVVHINSATFRNLVKSSNIIVPDELAAVSSLTSEEIRSDCLLDQQIYYSLGILSNDDDHLFLEGVLRAHDKFVRNKTNTANRLFIVSEISEEMGSYRHKIATLLNQQSADQKVRCFTADIGMAIRIRSSMPDRSSIYDQRMQIRCSRCNLNNDYTDNDRFHSPESIKEICLKREDEGIFYYCGRHDPEGLIRDNINEYGFAERIERYLVFKHIDMRIT